MADTIRYEGHAIVSADGMIADAAGQMPPTLRNDEDWRRFQSALDRAALVVVGRKGHRRHPNPGRRRLVLTRGAAALDADPADHRSALWNPAGMEIEVALGRLGVTAGTIAVTGGTGTFDLLGWRLDAFVLSEVHGLVLPGGTPTFSAGHPRSVLAAHGLRPGVAESLGAGVTLTVWSRQVPVTP